MSNLEFFIDFDGTITKKDVVDAILERFGDDPATPAGGRWLDVEKVWAAGKIGSRECLTRQIALVNATTEQMDAFIDTIPVDEHFVSFVENAQNLGSRVTIISDGFDRVIDRILKRMFLGKPMLLQTLPVYCNQLKFHSGQWKAEFPPVVCDHGCANCKPSVIQRLRNIQSKVVFVGDGLSDRFAVQVADLTFAKSKLLKFCVEKNILHKPFENFFEIESMLSFPQFFGGNQVEKI